MTLTEIRGDVFEARGDVYFAHCIASDLLMGAGIAPLFQRRFGIRGKIRNAQRAGESLKHPTCILAGKVFNLITKKYSYGKPTIMALRLAVRRMREIAVEKGVKRIAMPRIGCGLDRLSWAMVRMALNEEFAGTNVSLEVYKL